MNETDILEFLRAYARQLDVECDNKYTHKVTVDTSRQHSIFGVHAWSTENGWTSEKECSFDSTLDAARDDLRSTLKRRGL